MNFLYVKNILPIKCLKYWSNDWNFLVLDCPHDYASFTQPNNFHNFKKPQEISASNFEINNLKILKNFFLDLTELKITSYDKFLQLPKLNMVIAFSNWKQLKFSKVQRQIVNSFDRFLSNFCSAVPFQNWNWILHSTECIKSFPLFEYLL